jgi:hypothetical protein
MVQSTMGPAACSQGADDVDRHVGKDSIGRAEIVLGVPVCILVLMQDLRG